MNDVSKIVMADINDIMPNPLNPRNGNSIKTEEMQRIIKEKGWEAAITCYQKGSHYVILSGHRRWYAAQKLSLKQIPVFLVKAPESIKEEQERLGSLQGGKTDWSVYEWAKYTYEMWIFWEKCSFNELARKLNKSSSFVSVRVKVFEYYPHLEIEERLIKGRFSISVLYYLVGWLESLSRLKPDIVAHFKMDLLRTTMLSKIEKGLVNVLDIKDDLFIQKSSTDQMIEFLMHPYKKLSEALFDLNEGNRKLRGKSKIKTHIGEIRNANDIIKQLRPPQTEEEYTRMIQVLNDYKEIILRRRGELESYICSGST